MGQRPGSGEACVVHRIKGTTDWFHGDFTDARASCESAIRVYDADRHGSLAFRFGQDTRVSSLAYLSFSLWALGYVEQATRCADEAVEQARRSGHVHSLAFALQHHIWLDFHGRRDVVAKPLVEELVTLSDRHNLALWSLNSVFNAGWIAARSGDREQGLEAMGRVIERHLKSQTLAFMPFFMTLFAEVACEHGDPKAALASSDEALALIQRSGQFWCESDVHHVRGVALLRLRTPDVSAAEAAFDRAIEVARAQDAHSLQLRAAASLARLRRDQGRLVEARDLLAPVYSWFTEGFDTPELKDAKALLDELA
jgi:predicted ATPase